MYYAYSKFLLLQYFPLFPYRNMLYFPHFEKCPFCSGERAIKSYPKARRTFYEPYHQYKTKL